MRNHGKHRTCTADPPKEIRRTWTIHANNARALKLKQLNILGYQRPRNMSLKVDVDEATFFQLLEEVLLRVMVMRVVATVVRRRGPVAVPNLNISPSRILVDGTQMVTVNVYVGAHV